MCTKYRKNRIYDMYRACIIKIVYSYIYYEQIYHTHEFVTHTYYNYACINILYYIKYCLKKYHVLFISCTIYIYDI